MDSLHTNILTETLISNISQIKSSNWLIELSEIDPGKSVVLNENKFAYFFIHFTGISTLLLSAIACVVVLLDIYETVLKNNKLDLSYRFSLYMTISDLFWALFHSGEHIALLCLQTFPSKSVASTVAVNSLFFFGYRQILYAGISFYAYWKVVRMKSINLGRWEWKLHLFIFTFVASNCLVFWSFGGLGNSGYWFLAYNSATSGKLFSVTVCLIYTMYCILAFGTYTAIKRVIRTQQSVNSCYELPGNLTNNFGDILKNAERRQKYHVTAAKTLNTYVYISLCLDIPFGAVAWVFLFFGLFGYLEPVSCWLIAIGANCGGWVNAWGYFHNKKIKGKGRIRRANASSPGPSFTPHKI